VVFFQKKRKKERQKDRKTERQKDRKKERETKVAIQFHPNFSTARNKLGTKLRMMNRRKLGERVAGSILIRPLFFSYSFFNSKSNLSRKL